MASVAPLPYLHLVSRCLLSFVKLGVPDVIGDGELTIGDITKSLPEGVNEEAVARLLRMLTCQGLLEESAGPDGEFVYGLTPAGALLQTKAPQPSVAWGLMSLAGSPHWGAAELLPDYVAGKLAKAPFDESNGMPMFDYYDSHPEHAQPFNEYMGFVSRRQLPFLLKCEFWKELSGKTVVDVGGGLGTVMAAVAQAFPNVKCVCFDMPSVIDGAGEPPIGVTFAKGDMFDGSTIPKTDAIFMKYILHDWSDKNAEKILKSCLQALPDKGRVYISDTVQPGPGQLTPLATRSTTLDIVMMTLGGKERTRRQWEALAEATGFEVVAEEHAGGGVDVIVMQKR